MNTQNGVRREPFLAQVGGARRTVCALDEHAHTELATPLPGDDVFLYGLVSSLRGLCAFV